MSFDPRHVTHFPPIGKLFELGGITIMFMSKYDIYCTHPLIEVTSLKFGLHLRQALRAQVILQS